MLISWVSIGLQEDFPGDDDFVVIYEEERELALLSHTYLLRDLKGPKLDSHSVRVSRSHDAPHKRRLPEALQTKRSSRTI